MKLSKIVAEVRYEPTFLFEDPRTKNDIFKDLKSEFQLVDTEDNKLLLFINFKTKAKILIYHDKIIIDIDEPSEIGKIKIGSKFLPGLLKKFEIIHIDRFGVRAQYFNDKTGDLKKQNRFVAESLFHPQLMNFINQHQNTIDVSSKIGFSININHELTLNVGYGMHAAMPAHLVSNAKVPVTMGLEDAKPILDLDIYTTMKKEGTQINGFLNASCDYIVTYLNKMQNWVNLS